MALMPQAEEAEMSQAVIVMISGKIISPHIVGSLALSIACSHGAWKRDGIMRRKSRRNQQPKPSASRAGCQANTIRVDIYESYA
jgi:hypothetical protein